jgi:hypothetical protein
MRVEGCHSDLLFQLRNLNTLRNQLRECMRYAYVHMGVNPYDFTFYFECESGLPSFSNPNPNPNPDPNPLTLTDSLP